MIGSRMIISIIHPMNRGLFRASLLREINVAWGFLYVKLAIASTHRFKLPIRPELNGDLVGINVEVLLRGGCRSFIIGQLPQKGHRRSLMLEMNIRQLDWCLGFFLIYCRIQMPQTFYEEFIQHFLPTCHVIKHPIMINSDVNIP